MSTSKLEFKRLGLRNFLSFGNREEVIPLEGDFITVVLGENRDTGGEDSRNGVGKSAIIDALCYVLFGKVIRGISNQKLINKLSTKGQMIVWVEFNRGEFAYRVERTERPGKLLLLRKPIDSEEDFKVKEKRKLKFDIARGKSETTEQITEILGFDINLFEYLVANSSESTEFFRLTEEKQRAVIEPLFGFTIMSAKARLLKEDRKGKNTELTQVESAAEATKKANERITSQIQDLEARAREWEKSKTGTIEELQEYIERFSAIDVENEIAIIKDIERLEGLLRETKALIREREANKRAAVQEKKANEREAERAVSEIAEAEETIAALDESKCPTCHQHWEPDSTVRAEATQRLASARTAGNDALARFDVLDEAVETAEARLDGEHGNMAALKESLAQYDEVELTYRTVEEAAGAGEALEQAKAALTEKMESTNPHVDSIEGLREQAIVEVDETEVQALRREIRHYTYLIDLLTRRDSFLRKLVIDRWLPILNRRIAYWLELLELPHQVRFNPDLTVTIVNYHEEFDYGNLSRGQRARLRVALNFSFQDVFEYMNYPINMLAVDELLDSGICPRGAENAVTALREICARKDKRVFLITHRDDIAARVDDVMKIVLENNLSHIEDDLEFLQES